ncbi:SMI1/KNR4 family protein [Clostridium botulinum]|uniref:SMI1/KNR4 family protein n=1 Tax=Clostridium sp. ZBS12 TaxID=2949972 RepID=UPI000505A32D|nr:SMI1/KNR4 family protein [Clostridium sp. ZBS12]KFX57256.1 superoxide dismutase [Clostridium botulinum]MBY6802545.1 SMI1/KNR4 family protein [Clostridium botulinum]MBY6819210.1 SMI1/KNR4 family protein [Clostridium botulinum]NFJ50625.1 SMI1/KNR4 family protein [Clostridium botulinum]NFP09132.1 SMI1/KNR4 family protein [Clostridium botulinum]
MINEEKINFLNKYTLNKKLSIKILNVDEINNLEEGVIPLEWKEAFNEVEKSKKIKKILEIWEKNVKDEMSNVISFFKEFLLDVEFMNVGNKYSILYSIKNSNGKILYYEGGNPKHNLKNEHLKKSWNKIPKKLRAFYENVHDGFYYYPSRSMGLSSLENVVYLDDYEWGIIDDIESQNLKIDLGSSYGFFSNGMGTYVVIDYNNCDNDNATLWSSKEEPEYNLKFWDTVDEWTVIGFE